MHLVILLTAGNRYILAGSITSHVLRISCFRFCFATLIIGLLVAGFSSCNSSQKESRKKDDSIAHQRILDSLALVYDETKADADLHTYMTRLHERSGFNGNVLIAREGKIIYQNNMGWANHLLRDSLQITSQFELASVSKPLTATGILILVERGAVSLEDEMEKFFPGFPYPGITVEQLLTHRSGLPNYIYLSDSVWGDKRQGMSNDDAVELLFKHQPARFGAPDGRHFYNNTNYMLLASIIERATGQDFAVFMQENVFKPAGMHNTAVYSKAVYDQIPTHVIGHDRVWRRSVVQNFLDGPVGDKGIYSTVQDLFLFDQALAQGRLLTQRLLDSAYTSQSTPDKGVFGYGYGWRTFDQNGYRIVYHTGWWHGFRTLYVRDLEQEITIVLLSNMVNNSLLNLDRMYQILDMPVVRQGAYSGRGEYIGGN